MQLVLDTNVLLAALITSDTSPDLLYRAWRDGRFDLVTCSQQLDELREVTRRHGLRLRIRPAEAGRMVNDLRSLATIHSELPSVDVSPDPFDNYLLALAQASQAALLVTGDKRDLLALGGYLGTRIVTARDAVRILGLARN